MSEDQTEKARRQWRVRMALVIAGLLAIVALSLWIRTGHNSVPAALAAVLLLLVVGFFTQTAGDSRAKDDPAFAKGYEPVAQATAPIRRLGNGSAMLLLAVLAMLPVDWGLLHLIQLFPSLKHLLNGATVKEVLVVSFVVSFAVVGGLYLLGNRLLNRFRASKSGSE